MPRSALAAVALLIALAACSGSSPSPSPSEPASSSAASEAEASVPASEAAAASDPAAGQGGAVRLAIDTGDYAGNYISEFTSGDCDLDGSALVIDLSDRAASSDNETTLLDGASIRIDNLLDAMANPFGEGDVTAVFRFTRDGEPGAEVTILSGMASVESDVLTTGTVQIEGTAENAEPVTATITCYGVPLT